VVGRLIPAGTGLAYHAARKKQALEETDSDTVSAKDVEAALSEALSSEGIESDAGAEQVAGE
jgi:DNA-directed RNA polymerase subunit beta'